MNNSDQKILGRRVVCAAMQHPDGRIIITPRHFDMVAHAQLDVLASHGEDTKLWGAAVQGFVDQRGVFMTREEAWHVAKEQGQIIRRVGGDEGCLYSENLY